MNKATLTSATKAHSSKSYREISKPHPTFKFVTLDKIQEALKANTAEDSDHLLLAATFLMQYFGVPAHEISVRMIRDECIKFRFFLLTHKRFTEQLVKRLERNVLDLLRKARRSPLLRRSSPECSPIERREITYRHSSKKQHCEEQRAHGPFDFFL
jgi:phage gp36-like protein